MKRLFTSIFVVLTTALYLNASNFEVEEFAYRITNTAHPYTAQLYEYQGNDNEVTIPSSVRHEGITYAVTSIGHYAFASKSLKKITIPNSITSIEDCAFIFCYDLQTIEIPTSVTQLGVYAFEDTQWFRNRPDGAVYINQILYAYKGNRTEEIAIIVEEGTRVINPCAFAECEGLTSITLPNSVTQIGWNAFTGCTALTHVTLSENIVHVGAYAFYDCISLAEFDFSDNLMYLAPYALHHTAWHNNLPDGPIYVGKVLYSYKGKMKKNTTLVIEDGTIAMTERALEFQTNLETAVIPSTITEIPDNAFYECTSLKTIYLAEGLQSIGASAFINTALDSIVLPSTLKRIGSFAFYHSCKLQDINIPDAVTEMGNEAFCFCTSLKSFTIGKGLDSIPSGCFSYCNSLVYIEIPSHIKTIGVGAFRSCQSLSSIAIADGVTAIEDRAFCTCESLTTITLPNTIKRLGKYLFSHCTSMVSAYLPEKLSRIEEATFYFCTSLKSITLPKTISYIGTTAFFGCESLSTFVCEATKLPELGLVVFGYLPHSSSVLYVPRRTIDSYRTAEQWSDFAEILPIDDYDAYKKIIYNGQLLINHRSNTYTLTGQKVY